MKKVVIAVIVLLVIITAGILENVYVDKVFSTLDDKLGEVEQLVHAEDDEALDKLRSLTAWWEKQRGYMELFTYSPDLRAFSVALGETEGSLESDDFQNAQSKIQSLLVMSANLHQILDFNLEDVI